MILSKRFVTLLPSPAVCLHEERASFKDLGSTYFRNSQFPGHTELLQGPQIIVHDWTQISGIQHNRVNRAEISR
jgi:hypothetical protein